MKTRVNILNYVAPWLTGILIITAQGAFAEDQFTSQGGSSDYQLSLFGSENPLKLPEFESGALKLAQKEAESESQTDSAASTNTKSSGGNLAVAATNPIANLMQFQFQNTSSIESYNSSGYANAFVIQPVIPFDIPSDFFKFVVTRTTLPIVTTPDIDGVGQFTGLGDLVTFGFAVHEQKIGSIGTMWGVGPAFTLPTATSHKTGEGKFQMGPGAVLFMTLNKNLQVGAFGYQQWDITGDSERNYVSKTFFQPVLNYHFDSLFGQEGWYASLQDILWSYDWRAKQLDLPIGFRLGRVFKAGKMPVNVFVEPFGRPVFEGGAGGKYGVKLNVTFLFPK